MKLLHISDLHIGKIVKGFSMLDDQEYILNEIINIIDAENPDGVLICGDVYDKSIPPEQAITLFDDFLVAIAKRRIRVFIISGNHDCAKRLSFGSRLMDISGVYICPEYDGNLFSVTLEDNYGEFNIHMLPFIKPINVKKYFPDNEINSYNDAVETAFSNATIDKTKRNVLLTHQFITGSQRSDSEEFCVGTTENVSASIFDDFDYVALGHIHKSQKVSRETLRYCGTPLKYSLSEITHKKSVTIINFKEKNDIEISTIELKPLRDMKAIKGNYLDITSKKFYENFNLEDYFYITLTDEQDVPYALDNLRVIYKNIISLNYDNMRTRKNETISQLKEIANISPIDLISEFYNLQNNQSLSSEQKEYVEEVIKKVWGDEK